MMDVFAGSVNTQNASWKKYHLLRITQNRLHAHTKDSEANTFFAGKIPW